MGFKQEGARKGSNVEMSWDFPKTSDHLSTTELINIGHAGQGNVIFT